MYAIPIFVLAVVVLVAAFWSPIFAAVIAVPAFIAFLAFVGFARRADEVETPQEGIPNTSEDRSPERAGMWGEKEARG